MTLKKYISILLVTFLFFVCNAPVHAQKIEILDAAELQIALQKLNVLGSVLYYAAHPDDENTAALAYFSKGRKYRTAYLSVTRGGGGQNLIGPEKGVEIGILRTQELLSARKIDGAEQLFTRAIDFGYSKTPEETFEFWGKEEILADIVWIIRKFRPDVIITRFAPNGSGGHGHHTASGPLITEAFLAAANPNKFPEQLKYVKPWQPKRLLWNTWRPGQQDGNKLLQFDTGEYNPILGKSYTEMAAESRSNHKSQGFGSTGSRGTRIDYLQHVEGDPAKSDLFDGIDTSWNRVPGGRKVGQMLAEILKSFDPQHSSNSISKLIAVYAELLTLNESYWGTLKKLELLRIIQACAGLWIEAIADDFSAAPGDDIQIKITIVNRSNFPFKLQEISFPGVASGSALDLNLKNNDPVVVEKTVSLPKDFPISQPYWLMATPQRGIFSIQDQKIIGLAENPPSLYAKMIIAANGTLLEFSVPLLFRWRDRVDGELYRTFEIRPLVTLKMENKVQIFADNEPKTVTVTLKSHSQNGIGGELRLKATDKWQINPASFPFSFVNKYEEKQFSFVVSPPNNSDEAEIIAEAEINGEKWAFSIVEISYPHIKRQTYFPKNRMKVVKIDIKKSGSNIGYIMGAGDEVADGLKNLGYDVSLLNDEMLENEDLTPFDAIITGIRAYNTRERLKHTQDKLLQYVKNGGTLIVQYNVSRGLQIENIGPFPLTIGRDRVTEETAPISILFPNHQLLNFPNKITTNDFKGWVQERGLYFASQWDEKYETVLSSHDSNESDKLGGLLFTRYGKGVFIYTGYAWFRQLPAGVPGAFRLFVNLISAGKYNEK